MARCLDFFDMDASGIISKRLWLFDMDGTIYADDLLFDCVLDLMKAISDTKGIYVFITNNSSKSVEDYLMKLTLLGIPVTESNFYTSIQATVDYLAKHYAGLTIYCQGTESMVDELSANGIHAVTDYDESAAVVLVGFDTELTTDKLRTTCEMLYKTDATFIATNPDLACPVSFGFIPDCGSICQMIENATGKRPMFMGKPEPTMVYSVAERFGVSLDQTCVVGDRLYTDIAAGVNAGVDTICVLTGEATVDSIECSNVKPTWTFSNVKDIYELLNRGI